MRKKELLYDGPDISYHNGLVNMKKIKEAGMRRIGLRAGYGKGNVDQRYIQNAEACYNLEITPVLYWFSYAYTVEMARNEALEAIKQAAKYWTRCPIAFDFEYDSVNYARKKGVAITKRLCTDMAIAFLKEVKAQGHIPVIYANKDYLKNYIELGRIATEVGEIYVWYARYTGQISEAEIQTADIWQYTSSGSVPGVGGKVDMNHFYADFSGDKVEKRQTPNLNILAFQKACNADGIKGADGKPLKEDGLDGPNTQHARRGLNMAAKRAGMTWKVGSKGKTVKWWQERCNEILGRTGENDGLFGKKTRADTIEVQKHLNLTPDGVAGYNSIQMVFYN